MRNIGLSGEVYPVHLKPKDDELLSSWIVRLSLAHGLAPKQFAPFLQQRFSGDWEWQLTADLKPPQEVLNTLSKKTATPLSRIREMTLGRYGGQLYKRSSKGRLCHWIMPHYLGHVTRAQKFGMQACARCLAEDNEPYFRRSWRLAFVVVCPYHESCLIDRCPSCGNSIQFHRNAAALSRTATDIMTVCHKCQFDLRDVTAHIPAEPEIGRFQEHLINVARQGYIEIEGFENTASDTYFAVLNWILSVLFQSHELMRELQDAIFAYYNFDLSISRFTKKDVLENLNIRSRYEWIWLLRRLLIDHPHRYFRSYAQHNVMNRKWISKWMKTPSWYLSVMRAEGSRRNLASRQFNIKQESLITCHSRNRPVFLDEVRGYGTKYDIACHFAKKQKSPAHSFDYTDDLKRAARQLFLDGVSVGDIAHLFEIKSRTVGVWIGRHIF